MLGLQAALVGFGFLGQFYVALVALELLDPACAFPSVEIKDVYNLAQLHRGRF